MKVTTTRTINPIHFEDLEPHRFEDLCRQLIYDLKDWSAIEAIGRSGADGGIDIRATEVDHVSKDDVDDEQTGDGVADLPKQRVWIIQCKREKSIGPAKVSAIVENFFAQSRDTIYGYMLWGACDFSKAARDKFREEMNSHNIAEFRIVGKAELEDLLFQPRNDHLLFAYFGLSLQVARRTLKTSVNASLVVKRRLINCCDFINGCGRVSVLIRDPRNDSYPYINDINEFLKRPAWMYYEVVPQLRVDHIALLTKKCYAYGNFETNEWDAITGHNDCSGPQRLIKHGYTSPTHDLGIRGFSFWTNIPYANQAWLTCVRIIPYSRILAVDELGDRFNVAPHLLVEYRADDDAFEVGEYHFVEKVGPPQFKFIAKGESRFKYFPDSLPDVVPPNCGA